MEAMKECFLNTSLFKDTILVFVFSTFSNFSVDKLLRCIQNSRDVP